jgi:hypothetical protein
MSAGVTSFCEEELLKVGRYFKRASRSCWPPLKSDL